MGACVYPRPRAAPFPTMFSLSLCDFPPCRNTGDRGHHRQQLENEFRSLSLARGTRLGTADGSHSTASGICCPGWSKPSCYGEQGICTNKMKRSAAGKFVCTSPLQKWGTAAKRYPGPRPGLFSAQDGDEIVAAGSGKREIT